MARLVSKGDNHENFFFEEEVDVQVRLAPGAVR